MSKRKKTFLEEVQRIGRSRSDRRAVNAIRQSKGFSPISGNDSVGENIPEQQFVPVSGNDSVEEASIPESKKEEKKDSRPTKSADLGDDTNTVTLTHDELRQWRSQWIGQGQSQAQSELAKKDAALADIRREIEKLKEEALEQRHALEDKVVQERERANTLKQVFSQFGEFDFPEVEADKPALSRPYIASSALRGELHPRDAFKEYSDRYNSCDRRQVVSLSSGRADVQINDHSLLEFMSKHRDSLRRGVEAKLKDYGFLCGQRGYTGKDAPTTLADVEPVIQKYLSDTTRREHSARFVLWQFCNRQVSQGIPPGQTVLVPRAQHLTIGTTSADWTLTPGTRTDPTDQPLLIGSRAITVLEHGMGTVAVPAVNIPEFIMANSLMDLEAVLASRIGHNYHAFEDLSIFELWIQATTTLYCNNGDVVEAPGDVVAGGGGQMTAAFAGSLRAYLSQKLAPPFADGNYGMVLPSSGVAQLRKDLINRQRYIEPAQSERILNMLRGSTSQPFMERINGLVTTVNGFHIFESNNISSGVAGSPGVQDETFGLATVTTRTGFVFGADSIACVNSMPMELRQDKNDDGGRIMRLFWKSHEGYGHLDTDAAIAPGANPQDNQQTRVFQVRLADTEV